MHQLSITQTLKKLREKTFSATELTQHMLQRAEQHNQAVNCFINLNQEYALTQAALSDKRLAHDNHVALDGLVIAHKDIFCTKQTKTTCGSKMLENFQPPYDATVVNDLQEAGVVSIGKTNMDEFAMGSSNETSYFGAVTNPWDSKCVAGGSSGGSAAAVAAGLVFAATGTDTGGSIRQPASLCGITGIKPTYGRISRYGVIAFASSLDQAGILARTAEDCALVLEQMIGFDDKDASSVDREKISYSKYLNNPVKGLTAGVISEHLSSASATVQNNLSQAIKNLEDMGIKVKEISIPSLSLAINAYYVIAPAECSSNLARFDGIRYGLREDAHTLEELYRNTRSSGFGTEVKRRILIGTHVLSAGFFDAYYLKAQKIRRLVAQDFQKSFSQCDFLIGPTTPNSAFALNSKPNPLDMYLEDSYTIPANLAGICALSIPYGTHKNKPLGLQIMGNHFCEHTILNVAHQYQLHTNFQGTIAHGF